MAPSHPAFAPSLALPHVRRSSARSSISHTVAPIVSTPRRRLVCIKAVASDVPSATAAGNSTPSAQASASPSPSTASPSPPTSAIASPTDAAAPTEIPHDPIVSTSFELSDDAESEIRSLDDVSELVALADEFDLRDLRIEHNGVQVEITRAGGRGFDNEGNLAPLPAPVVQHTVPGVVQDVIEMDDDDFAAEDDVAAPAAVDGPSESEVATASATPSVIEEEKDPDAIYDTDFVVTSNRVGFFFCGAKNKPPLVNVGDHVNFNQPVCIIEQLGQQYVYLSEASGTVVKVFVEDGDAVMYGTQVMVIRPD